MKSGKAEAISGSGNRQKIIVVAVLIIGAVLIWQMFGLFGGGSANESASQITPQAGQGAPQPQQTTPKPAALPPSKPMTEMEVQLIKLQQETQARYVEAMNQLQLLKVQRDIAQTTKDISAATLDKVTAEKKIVDLLTPTAPAPVSQSDYAKSLEAQGGGTAPLQSGSTATAAPAPASVTYTVISVTQLQSRWAAVIGAQGNLYNVHIGDVLPLDGSTVVSIQKDGVVLKNNDVKRKISLVPII